ncbi:branched-chain amino acid ABC transporter permease [Clostridiaceae bacterium HSG29]|nr:branched-chain amino acid ABC transporter permease [Clostridiaceae bacterium HSG29]
MLNKNNLIKIGLIVVTGIVLAILNATLGRYSLRILNLAGIYIILGLSLNLINGFTGLFSLGHAGFMAVGAYASALLTMSPAQKSVNFFVKPIVPILANVEIGFLPAIIIGGFVAAIVGAILAAPILRLKDDYLAIATLGFGEIIRVIFTNTQSLTNGALGLKGLPSYTNTGYTWTIAILTIIFMFSLRRSSYGKAFMAIREDEIAAESMGIDLFKHKLLAFTIGSFFAGVGGALLAHLMGTIDPLMFRFLMTFNILLIVVLGEIGSISGTIVSAIIVTISMEWLRFLDGPIDLGFMVIHSVPGMRMVLFSLLLMIVILYYQHGLMGQDEITLEFLKSKLNKFKKKEA